MAFRHLGSLSYTLSELIFNEIFSLLQQQPQQPIKPTPVRATVKAPAGSDSK